VEVGTAETKGADCGAARCIALRQPGAFYCGEIKGGIAAANFIQGFCNLDGWRQNLVVQGKGSFYEAGCASCRLGMADLGLYRAERAPWLFSFAVNFPQGRYFDRIADLCPGAVSFKQADAFRGDAGSSVGIKQCPFLPAGIRGIDRITFAVT